MKLHPWILLALISLTACAPRLLGGDDDQASSSGETTAEGSTTLEPTTSPATTSPATTSTTATTNDTVFVPDDLETSPESCDNYLQDCPEGEKCVPYVSGGGTWDESKCVPIMGSQATGEPCWSTGPEEATDNCDATGLCWDTDDQGNGICTAFCTGTPDDAVCPPGSSCQIAADSPVAVCIPICNPLVQDCNVGYACYWANNDFNCIFTTQNIPTGEPCGYINDCAGGNICIDATWFPACMGSACCSNFCNVDLGPAQCEGLLPGTECVTFFESGMAPPGYENLGVCILSEP